VVPLRNQFIFHGFEEFTKFKASPKRFIVLFAWNTTILFVIRFEKHFVNNGIAEVLIELTTRTVLGSGFRWLRE